jgi:hypothetical protein
MTDQDRIVQAILHLSSPDANGLVPERRLSVIYALATTYLGGVSENNQAAPLLSVYDNGEVIDADYGGES